MAAVGSDHLLYHTATHSRDQDSSWGPQIAQHPKRKLWLTGDLFLEDEGSTGCAGGFVSS